MEGRHYLVHGQHYCPLKATALNRFQVRRQIQLCPFTLATRGVLNSKCIFCSNSAGP